MRTVDARMARDYEICDSVDRRQAAAATGGSISGSHLQSGLDCVDRMDRRLRYRASDSPCNCLLVLRAKNADELDCVAIRVMDRCACMHSNM